MGAVAALMYMNSYKKDNWISAMILDSPFSDFMEICKLHGKKMNFFAGLLFEWGLDATNDICKK